MKDKTILFGIDCDEVLRPLLPGMLRLYNKKFNTDLTMDDIHSFNVYKSFPKLSEYGIDTRNWFFEENGNYIYSSPKPYKDVIESIRKLREIGKVIIVTNQNTLNSKIWTLKWLNKFGIEYDEILFLKDKSLFEGDYFIDDNPDNFINSKSKHGILITAPYNRNINLNKLKEKTFCLDMKRYNSFTEFVNNLLKIKRKI